MRRLRLIHVWVRSNYPAAGLNEEPGAGWRLRAADDLDVDARLLGEFSGGGSMFGQLVLAAASSRRRTARSCSLAAVTSTARSRPVVSVRMCRLMPSIFLAPSNPRSPGTGLALTEDESTTAPVGAASRPSASLARCRSATSVVSQTPRLVQRSIGLPG